MFVTIALFIEEATSGVMKRVFPVTNLDETGNVTQSKYEQRFKVDALPIGKVTLPSKLLSLFGVNVDDLHHQFVTSGLSLSNESLHI